MASSWCLFESLSKDIHHNIASIYTSLSSVGKGDLCTCHFFQCARKRLFFSSYSCDFTVNHCNWFEIYLCILRFHWFITMSIPKVLLKGAQDTQTPKNYKKLSLFGAIFPLFQGLIQSQKGRFMPPLLLSDLYLITEKWFLPFQCNQPIRLQTWNPCQQCRGL